MTTTTQTGGFALPACGAKAAAGYRERNAGLVGVVLNSSLLATASDIASARNTVDVPTPVPIRLVGAHG